MQTDLTQNNVASFFDAIVTDLHERNKFETFPEPKGEAAPERSLGAKVTHDELSMNRPGQSSFVGDQPFQLVLSAFHFNKANPIRASQKEIWLKNQSVREAIAEYMPDHKFAGYLRYFSENLTLPEHQKCLERAFASMVDQLRNAPAMPEAFRMNDYQLEQFINLGNTKARLKHMRGMLATTQEENPRFADGKINFFPLLRPLTRVAHAKNLDTCLGVSGVTAFPGNL